MLVRNTQSEKERREREREIAGFDEHTLKMAKQQLISKIGFTQKFQWLSAFLLP